jgi:cytochrome c biogenesis protein CcmG/thiol:disulfide interchange protein DsbE
MWSCSRISIDAGKLETDEYKELKTMRMKPFLLTIVLCLCAQQGWAVEAGDVAPRWQAYSFDGNPVTFPSVLEENPAVVVFWATWCPYCKAFMPYLEAIEADYRSRGVRVVTINAKEDGSGNPQAYIEALDFPMIAIRNGNAIARAYGVEFIPGVMIVDGSGMVAYRRPWTDLPAGQEVAELWDGQVRAALDALFE